MSESERVFSFERIMLSVIAGLMLGGIIAGLNLWSDFASTKRMHEYRITDLEKREPVRDLDSRTLEKFGLKLNVIEQNQDEMRKQLQNTQQQMMAISNKLDRVLKRENLGIRGEE